MMSSVGNLKCLSESCNFLLRLLFFSLTDDKHFPHLRLIMCDSLKKVLIYR